MALAYTPPSVTIQEDLSPNIAPLLAVPASVCLVGRASGFQSRTEQVLIPDDADGVPVAAVLTQVPADAALTGVTGVTDALDPLKGAEDGTGYVATTDYTVSTSGKSITRTTTGDLVAGSLVNVSYTYLANNYFDPIRLDDMSAIEHRFGTMFKDDGTTINSPLSFAAGVAFENGATSIVCQPVFARATPGDSTTAKVAPTDTNHGTVATWTDTVSSLRDIEDVNIIVPIIGQSQVNIGDGSVLNVHQIIQDHMKFMKGNDQFLVAIFGEDSSKEVARATRAMLVNHATTLRSRYGGELNQQSVFISPSRFTRVSPRTGQTYLVGGQYLAAAIGGMLASRPVSAPLTGDTISGFVGVPEGRTKADKNAEAQLGMFVVEQRGGNVRIRHGITMDNSATATRELSVVRAKHRMVESIRDTIDTQIIGKVVADGNAPLVVRSAIIGVLERLVTDRDLVGYANVTARTLALDPTTVEVRFSYRPAFPLNYVNIRFAIDLTSGATAIG